MESTRAMNMNADRTAAHALAESKNCKILLFPTADRHFDAKFKCPTGQALFWVKLPSVRSFKRESNAWGLPEAGEGWAVLELTGT